MKAIILAAGYNKRLNGVIELPKTLLKTSDSTILERQLNALGKAGFRKEDIFIVAGYKKELIQAIHPNIIVNEKFIEYENAYSVFLALRKLSHSLAPDEPIFIFDGDLVYDDTLLSHLLSTDKPNILVTKEISYSEFMKDEVILSDENLNVTEMFVPARDVPIDKKYSSQNLFTFLGVLKISGEKVRDFLFHLENPSNWKGWYTIPLTPVVSTGNFYNFVLPESLKFYFDIDVKEDLEKFFLLDQKSINKAYKMFVAGPVNISADVKKSLIYEEIGHRESEFTSLYSAIKKKLMLVFGANSSEYSAVIVGGSGTSATESVISSVLHGDKKTLVITNGAFGDRIAEICRNYSIPIFILDYGWGGYPNLNEIETFLSQDPTIEAVTMVLMETSTGMLNPVNAVGALCKEYSKVFIVDAVSSLGGEALNVVEDNIDYCISNTNKCLGGFPVLGIVCAKNSSLEKSKDVKPRSYTLDLFKHIKYAKESETPFTPAIPLYTMLNQALDELIREGIGNRITRYKKNNFLLRAKLKEMGLDFHLNESHMSHLMINVIVPAGLTYEQIHHPLKSKGYVIYPGKEKLVGKIIHIGNIGTLTEEDVLNFCEDLKEILRTLYTSMAETALEYLKKLS